MIGAHLVRIGRADSDRCWWCHSGQRQSRHHLFFRCHRWATEGRKLWKKVGKACGWENPRAPSARLLSQGERATPVVLEFLRETKVGKIVTLAQMEEVDEKELEEIEFRPLDGEGGWREGDEGRPGPP